MKRKLLLHDDHCFNMVERFHFKRPWRWIERLKVGHNFHYNKDDDLSSLYLQRYFGAQVWGGCKLHYNWYVFGVRQHCSKFSWQPKLQIFKSIAKKGNTHTHIQKKHTTSTNENWDQLLVMQKTIYLPKYLTRFAAESFFFERRWINYRYKYRC